MFAQFIKPRWQHKDPAMRLRAVAKLSGAHPDDAQVLTQIANHDSDTSVRCAAIAELNDLPLLGTLQQHNNSDIANAAAIQIQKLLAGTTTHCSSLGNRLRLINLTDNDAVLQYVAEHSQDSECRQAAIARIQDAGSLEQLAIDGPDEPTRVAAITRVNDVAVLRRIIKDSRDKRVQRLAREQLKSVQAVKQEKEQALVRCQTLLDELLAHTKRMLDNLYRARLEQLQSSWQQVVSHASAQQAATAAQYIKACAQRLDQVEQEKQHEQALQQALTEQQAALATLQELQQSISEESWQDINSLRALVTTQKNRWHAAAEIATAEPTLTEEFNTALQRWQKCFGCLDALNTLHNDKDLDHDNTLTQISHDWPAEFSPPPELAITDTVTEPEACPSPAPDSELKKSLQKVLGTLQRELRQRNLKHANRLWRKAEHLLAEEGAPPWSNRLKKMQPELDELRDWHSFAASPKKEILCQQMEALIESNMDAAEKAGAIHALHDDWRELMSADQDADQNLWDRFRNASDKAYEPCREHFRELDAQRSANLEKRKVMIQQLKNFIQQQDWSQADWEKINDIRRAAPNEWRGYQPINFTDNREIGKQFSQLLGTLDEKLHEASEQHCLQLDKLIEEAQAILTSEQTNEPARDSIDRFKALQERWKKTGWVQPGRYRTLNKTFRKLGDQLFKQVDNQRKAYKQQMQAQATTLRDALHVFEQALNQNNAPEQFSTLQHALQQQAHALQELPCPPKEKTLEQQRQALLQKLKQLKQWQPRWQHWQSLEQKIANATNADETPAQRQLAVAIEFATGVDSPADAKQERMQWQLQQLQQSMTGANQKSALESVKAFLQEREDIINLGLAESIRERLSKALAVLEPKR